MSDVVSMWAAAAAYVIMGAGLLWVARLLNWALRRRRDRANCFHHDRWEGTSWIQSQIIDPGKMFWCTHCQKTWMV